MAFNPWAQEFHDTREQALIRRTPRCLYCDRRATDARGRFSRDATTCLEHSDLPGREPLEDLNRAIRIWRAS